jgi:hemolysin activation/secretion protein
LPWRDKLEIFGLTEQDRPDIGPDFAGSGHSNQLSARYVIPLATLPHLTQDLRVGYDIKTTDNNLDFGGTTVSKQTVEIDQFSLIYQGTFNNDHGSTTLTNTLVYSPGHPSGRNATPAFQPGLNQSGTAFATADYAYDRLDIENTNVLPGGYEWLVRASAQMASVNLLPSEQLSIGGLDTVRGYREFVAGGAQGVLLSSELRTPVKAIGSGTLQGDAFIDYGRVTDVEAIPGTPRAFERTSAGVGVRYSLGPNLNLRAEIGVPIGHASGLHTQTEVANVTLSAGF